MYIYLNSRLNFNNKIEAGNYATIFTPTPRMSLEVYAPSSHIITMDFHAGCFMIAVLLFVGFQILFLNAFLNDIDMIRLQTSKQCETFMANNAVVEDRLNTVEETLNGLIDAFEKLETEYPRLVFRVGYLEKKMKKLLTTAEESDKRIDSPIKETLPNHWQLILNYLRTAPTKNDVRNIRAHLMESNPTISRIEVNNALYSLFSQGKVTRKIENNGTHWSLA